MISHFRWVADPRHPPHLLTLEVQGDSIYVIKVHDSFHSYRLVYGDV
jgi:hypothetical protein